MDRLIEELEIALNPRFWGLEHHEAWHKNIPDVQKAFEALKAIALENAKSQRLKAD